MNPSELLPWIGAALQWARARSKFKDVWVALIMVAAGTLFYAMASSTPFTGPWREEFGIWWKQMVLILSSTQAMSMISNIVTDANPKLGSLMPVTDSK